jgi:PKHD-type hydroxylase
MLLNLIKNDWSEARTEDQVVDTRKSNVQWLNDQWVYDLIWDYMSYANENAGWKYNITAAENCQIARYTKGEFYSWHRDGLGTHNDIDNNPDNKNLFGKVRKLSMSILLNDDYEGGNFNMNGERGIKDAPNGLIDGLGSIIVFPSFIEHQVAPVTKGTRYSLVTWFVGEPFV